MAAKLGNYFSDLVLLDVSNKKATIGSAITGDTNLALFKVIPPSIYIFSGQINNEDNFVNQWDQITLMIIVFSGFFKSRKTNVATAK